jgi:hypothetical protein
MYCYHCNLKYESNFRFCERCGNRLIPAELDSLESELNEQESHIDEPNSLASFFSHEPIPKTKIYSRRI